MDPSALRGWCLPDSKGLHGAPVFVPILIMTAYIAVTVDYPLTSLSLPVDFSPQFYLTDVFKIRIRHLPFKIQWLHSHFTFKTLKLHIKFP